MRQYSRWILVLSAILLMCTGAIAQDNNIVPPDAITSPLHRANVGRIAFLSSTVPLEQLREQDFLESSELKEGIDLEIRVFMANALINYLHALAPSLSPEELDKVGNFQFTFLVDDSLIYTENLHHGAFGTQNKNSRTTFRIPLLSSSSEDSWGRFMWDRFMLRGGEDALTPGQRRLRLQIRPYVNAGELIVGDLIAEGAIDLTVPAPNVSEGQIAIQPIAPGSGWDISNDDYDHEKIRELNLKIAANSFKNITSIVVIKDGKLLIEEYFNGAGRDALHDTRSVGKTFASAVMGIAIAEGYISSEDAHLSEFYDLDTFANYSPRKERVTVRHLLTMSSGFAGNDNDESSPGYEENMYPTDNWVKFALDLPMDSTKASGRDWSYFTAGVVVLGDILHHSVPGGLEKYAEAKLFGPLEITSYRWQYTPQGVPNTAGGLAMRSVDYAKFGQLYKNGGLWKGQQIISQEWVRKSLTPQLTVPGDGETKYGYLFWNTTYRIDGREYEASFCSGNGGNKIFVFKDVPLVVVITSTAYNTPYGHLQANKIIERHILPATMRYGSELKQ